MPFLSNDDIKATRHYTTDCFGICGNLLRYVPEDAKLVEPFVGAGDLLRLFPSSSWEAYDIESSRDETVKRDTLMSPPDYKGKWVITNPPFLALNKADDKRIFQKWKVDDLYKATMLSILDCEGGILILPLNFFTDEVSKNVRVAFLDRFEVKEMNVFNQPVFGSTSYSVCSFAFHRKAKAVKESQVFLVHLTFEQTELEVVLHPQYGYRIAGEIFSKLDKVKPVFGRLTNRPTDWNTTNIKLYALDSRNGRIRCELDDDPYVGKSTDRMFATLTCKHDISEELQLRLVEEFNHRMESLRKAYSDLPLTNYRDYGRKRIGFDLAYRMMTEILLEERDKEKDG